MRRIAKWAPVIFLLLLSASCAGGGNSSSNSTIGSSGSGPLSGPWEAYAQSSGSNSGPVIYETNLAQFSTSVQSTAIEVLSDCVRQDSSSGISGTLNASAISLTLNYRGVTETVTGTLSGDNSISGVYTKTGACGTDSGTWTASKIAPVSGTYSGSITDSSNQTYPFTAILINSNLNLTGNLSISSPCFNQLSLSGQQIGAEAPFTGTDGLGDSVQFVAVANDTAFTTASGVYSVDAGSCSGDFGTFSAAKAGSAAVPSAPLPGRDRVVSSLLPPRG